MTYKFLRGTIMKKMDAKMSIRTFSDVKKDATKIYESLGVDMTTVINVFLRKSIACGGFPFDVREEPNTTTKKAMKNAYKNEGLSRTFKNTDDLFKHLNS